jgi:biotin synthase-like enzyme
MNPHPESVPVNGLVAVEGTPLEDNNLLNRSNWFAWWPPRES